MAGKPSLNLANYVFDYFHQPFMPGMKTRFTICRAYRRQDFEIWQQKQRAIREFIGDSPALMVPPQEVRLKKPPAVAEGIAICDLATTSRDPKTGRERRDHFDRKVGRQMSFRRTIPALIEYERRAQEEMKNRPSILDDRTQEVTYACSHHIEIPGLPADETPPSDLLDHAPLPAELPKELDMKFDLLAAGKAPDPSRVAPLMSSLKTALTSSQ